MKAPLLLALYIYLVITVPLGIGYFASREQRRTIEEAQHQIATLRKQLTEQSQEQIAFPEGHLWLCRGNYKDGLYNGYTCSPAPLSMSQAAEAKP